MLSFLDLIHLSEFILGSGLAFWGAQKKLSRIREGSPTVGSGEVRVIHESLTGEQQLAAKCAYLLYFPTLTQGTIQQWESWDSRACVWGLTPSVRRKYLEAKLKEF